MANITLFSQGNFGGHQKSYSADNADISVDFPHGVGSAKVTRSTKVIVYQFTNYKGAGADLPPGDYSDNTKFPEGGFRSLSVTRKDEEVKAHTTAFFLETDLSQAITNAADRGHFNNIDAPAALQQKSRWINVTIANETQFNIVFSGKRWFDEGRFWTAPGNTSAFNQSNFSGCNNDLTVTPKVSGAATFEIVIPGEDNIPISIAFSNPFNFVSPRKTRAEFTDDYKGTWDRMVDSSASSITKDLGKRKTADEMDVNVSFRLTSVPGSEAKVTVTQVVHQTIGCK